MFLPRGKVKRSEINSTCSLEIFADPLYELLPVNRNSVEKGGKGFILGEPNKNYPQIPPLPTTRNRILIGSASFRRQFIKLPCIKDV